MKKENIRNLLLAIVVLLVLSLTIWNTIALNEISGHVRDLERDIVGTPSPYAPSGGLKSDIANLEWDLRDIQQQLDNMERLLRLR